MRSISDGNYTHSPHWWPELKSYKVRGIPRYTQTWVFPQCSLVKLKEPNLDLPRGSEVDVDIYSDPFPWTLSKQVFML